MIIIFNKNNIKNITGLRGNFLKGGEIPWLMEADPSLPGWGGRSASPLTAGRGRPTIVRWEESCYPPPGQAAEEYSCAHG